VFVSSEGLAAAVGERGGCAAGCFVVVDILKAATVSVIPPTMAERAAFRIARRPSRESESGRGERAKPGRGGVGEGVTGGGGRESEDDKRPSVGLETLRPF
jgi:hypothetical protein